MMKKFIQSKIASWGAFLLIVMWVILAIFTDEPWWGYISIFFAFMMTFCHLASLYLRKISIDAASKLDVISFVCGILMLVSFIIIYILESFFFKL